MDNKKINDRKNAWDSEEKEYVEELKKMDKHFKEQVKAEEKEVRNMAQAAKKEVNEGAKAVKSEAKDELKKVEDRKKTFGHSEDAELDAAKKERKAVRDTVNNESWNAINRIDDREVRFEEGLDRIKHDVTTHSGRHESNTSHADAHGNYMATDAQGTVNNYMEQMNDHTQSTKERIRDDARRTVHTLGKKVR